MPLVTVVTAAQNVADLLPETIESIRSQTFTDWNMVIVDDASTDATAEVATAAASRDKRISVVRLEESVGSYGAANVAMLAADARYLARIDGDDVASPFRLEKQLALMAERPAARGCATGWQALLTTGLEERVQGIPTHRNAVIKWMMWFRSNLIHSTMLVDTEFFQRLGGYGPERVAEDFRLWSALVRADALAVTDEPLVAYRFHAGQITAAVGGRSLPARARITLDHIRHCTDHEWSLDDARDLRFIGESDAPFSVERALTLLDRFDAAWQADSTLTADDRAELQRQSAMRRLRHLRHSMGNKRSQVLFALMRRSSTIAASTLRVVKNRSNPWP